MVNKPNKLTIHVPAVMEKAIDVVIVRAGYLFPTLQLEAIDSTIVVQSFDLQERETIEKEIKYLLYREHIRQEFTPYRKKALDRIYGTTT